MLKEDIDYKKEIPEKEEESEIDDGKEEIKIIQTTLKRYVLLL